MISDINFTSNLQTYSDSDNVKEFKKYLKDKQLNCKLVNNMLMTCCEHGKINLTKWLINRFSNIYNLKYEPAFKIAAKNLHIDVTNHLLKIICEYSCDLDDLFAFCCANELVDIAKTVYDSGFVVVTEIFNKKTKRIKRYGLIKNLNVLIYLNVVLQQENINETFLVLCSSGMPETIIEFYKNNTLFLPYKSHCAFGVLCHKNKGDCIKWLLSLYLPESITLVRGLIIFYKHDNMEMVNYLNNLLNSKGLMTREITDAMYGSLLDTKDYDIIVNIHKTLKYKMLDIEFIVECISQIGQYTDTDENDTTYHEYFKYMYFEYIDIFEKNLEFKVIFFKNCCNFVNVKNITWLHNRLKLFTSASDKLYLNCIETSCRSFNIYVAEWLADLYDEYEINVIEFSNHIYENNTSYVNLCIIHEKLSDEKKLYKKISKNTISEYNKLKLLGINKFINKSDLPTVSDCLICMERPSDLVKLSCNHYSCVTCLCSWFANQEQEKKHACSYCKTPIVWNDCKLLYSNVDEIMKSVHESIKLTDEQTNEITYKYKEILGKN
jgi:hypothetical protein